MAWSPKAISGREQIGERPAAKPFIPLPQVISGRFTTPVSGHAPTRIKLDCFGEDTAIRRDGLFFGAIF